MNLKGWEKKKAHPSGPEVIFQPSEASTNYDVQSTLKAELVAGWPRQRAQCWHLQLTNLLESKAQ